MTAPASWKLNKGPLTAERVADIGRLFEAGWSREAIASEVGCSASTVSRRLKESGLGVVDTPEAPPRPGGEAQVALSSCHMVSRPGEAPVVRWQSESAGSLRDVAAFLGVQVQTVKLNNPKLRAEDPEVFGDESESDWGPGRTRRLGAIFRVEVLASEFYGWSLPVEGAA